MLRFENITKEYRKSKHQILSLEDITLDINYGEVVGLIGENGAGKTTLIKILGGLSFRVGYDKNGLLYETPWIH